MSTTQAQELIRRLQQDPTFRERLVEAPETSKREILQEYGYGDVRLRHLDEALPESFGGSMSDEEFAAVAGGLDDTSLVTAGASAAGGAAITVAAAVAGAAFG